MFRARPRELVMRLENEKIVYSLLCELDKHCKYNEYFAVKNTLTCELNCLKLNDINNRIHILQKHMEYSANLRYWQDIKITKPMYVKKELLLSQITLKQTQLDALKTEHSKITFQYESYMSHKSSVNNTLAYLTLLKQRTQCISHINDIFDGFRQWLYSSIILPKLTSITNKIVDSVLDTDCTLTVNINKKNQFDWMIKDCGNISTIKTAGGFREFLFGLALRIAMTHIGCSNINCNQLFLDEGFVSSSNDNLLKMPSFLKTIFKVQNYDSIFLVSHLQIIKDCSDINAKISRSDNLSQLGFGKQLIINTQSSQPTIDLVPKKDPIPTKLSIKQELTTTAPKISQASGGKCAALKNNGAPCTFNAKNGIYCGTHSKNNSSNVTNP